MQARWQLLIGILLIVLASLSFLLSYGPLGGCHTNGKTVSCVPAGFYDPELEFIGFVLALFGIVEIFIARMKRHLPTSSRSFLMLGFGCDDVKSKRLRRAFFSSSLPFAF